MHKKVLDLNLR